MGRRLGIENKAGQHDDFGGLAIFQTADAQSLATSHVLKIVCGVPQERENMFIDILMIYFSIFYILFWDACISSYSSSTCHHVPSLPSP